MNKTNEQKGKSKQPQTQTKSAIPDGHRSTARVPPLPSPMTAAEFLEEYWRQQESWQARRKDDPRIEPLVDSALEPVTAASVATGGAGAKSKPHPVIQLGVDVHVDRYVVVRQIDGGSPQPAQRFSPEQAQPPRGVALLSARRRRCYSGSAW